MVSVWATCGVVGESRAVVGSVDGLKGEVGVRGGGDEAVEEEERFQRAHVRYDTTDATTSINAIPPTATPAIAPVPNDEDDDEADVPPSAVGQLSPTATSLLALHATRTATSWAGSTIAECGPV